MYIHLLLNIIAINGGALTQGVEVRYKSSNKPHSFWNTEDEAKNEVNRLDGKGYVANYSAHTTSTASVAIKSID